MQNDSYNRGGFIAFVFSMSFSVMFFIYVTFLHPGIDLKEVPEVAAPEQKLADGSAPAAAVDVSGIAKPWEENPDMVAHGGKLYATNCAVCHGPKGLGDGPGGASLNPKPRNLVEGKWTKGGDSISQFNTLTKGIEGTSMAPFAHMPTVDRWALVQFIHSITENKVKDNPAKLEAFAKAAK